MRKPFVIIASFFIVLGLFVHNADSQTLVPQGDKTQTSKTQSGAQTKGAQALTFKRQPNSAQECAVCHYEMMDIFVYDNKSTDIALYPEYKEVASERMCFSCHDGSVGDSRIRVWDAMSTAHTTGTPLKEGMKRINELPLVDGKITCMTCHTAHGESQQGSGLTDIANSLFLRMPNDASQLCKSCHEDKSGTDSHSMGKLDKAHVPGVVERLGTIGTDGSMTCLSCHTVHGAKTEKLTIDTDKDMKLCGVCHDDLFKNKDKGGRLITPHVNYELPLPPKVSETIVGNGGILGEDGGIVCYSCHKIHNAKGKSAMLSAKKGFDLCSECHTGFDKVKGKSHDLSRVEDFMTIDGKTFDEVGLCGGCHTGHSWRLGYKHEETDKITNMCRTCHNPYGVANERTIDLKKNNHFMGDIDPVFFDKNMKVPKNAVELSKSTNRFLVMYMSDKKAVRAVFGDKKMSCVTCHDVHSGDKTFVRESAVNGTLCLACHEEKAPSMKTSHGSGKVGETCLSCHDVHNSDNKGLVRDGLTNDGCLTCHGENIGKDGKLPRGMIQPMPKELVFKGHNHPTGIDNATKFPEPMYNKKDGKFDCVSCHDPHVSDNHTAMRGSFLRANEKIKNTDDFCATCHEAQRPVIGSDHMADPKDKVIGNKRTGRVQGSCDMCHKVHGAYAAKGIPANKVNYTNPDDLCLSCHNQDGKAKDKKIDLTMGHQLGELKNAPKDAPVEYFTKENGKLFMRCATCHDPHLNGPKIGEEGTIANSFLKRFDDKPNMCESCHEDKGRVSAGGHGIENFKNKTNDIKTKIAAQDTCGACHTMHNSKPEFLMAGNTDKERCMECHDKDKLSVKHIEMSHRFDVDIKDRDKKKLPLENGLMTCNTCHITHNATPKLIRSETGRGGALCITCHEEQEAVRTSKHNMRLSGTADEDIARMAAESSCEPCHSSHDVTRKNSIPIGRESAKGFMIEEHCVSCHNKRGIANEKVPESLRHLSVMKMLKSIEKFTPYIYDGSGKKSAAGDIECSTCHNPHIWSVDNSKLKEFYKTGLKVDGDNTTSFLKGGVAGDFCFVCHENSQEWFNNFHSTKFREANSQNKQPASLLERIIKQFE